MQNTASPNQPLPELGNPFETAKVLRAFAECSRTIQDTVVEMATIVDDPASDDDDRAAAFDAIMEALFPGTTADILQTYHQKISSPELAQAAEQLHSEQLSFVQRLTAAMKQKNMTQEALAEAAGVGQSAVSNILTRGCRPQRRTVEKFAAALGLKPTELYPELH